MGRDTSAIMRRVRSSGTGAEMELRRSLWSRGLRYRIGESKLPGKPDILIPGRRVAVFVDGDLWHGNQWRTRGLRSLDEQFLHSARRDYWLRKIRGNMSRDCAATAELLADGWRVLRLWESDIHRDLEGCVQMALEIGQASGFPDAYSRVPDRTVAEFFAGIGLVRMALERHGWSVTYANDNDHQKYQMYRSQFPDAPRHFDPRDIHTVPAECVPTVTLATASFPCNDLSLAGARDGLDGCQSSAFWGLIRILNGMGSRRPPLILLENVPGFLTSHGGRDLTEALLALNRFGYGVDCLVMDAVHFVPQSRQRMFVVATLDPRETSLGFRDLPPELWDESRPKSVQGFIAAHPEIDWHIRPVPRPPSLPTRLDDVLQDLPEHASEWWSEARADYLLNQMSPRHRAIVDRMIAGDKWSYGTVFRRIRHGKSMAELRADGVAGCLRTPRGGSGRQIVVRAGMGTFAARLLTPRECARLMGADEYPISVPLNQALFGFGDAVCVPVVEWIAEYYLNPLANEMIRGVPLIPQSLEAAR